MSEPEHQPNPHCDLCSFGTRIKEIEAKNYAPLDDRFISEQNAVYREMIAYFADYVEALKTVVRSGEYSLGQISADKLEAERQRKAHDRLRVKAGRLERRLTKRGIPLGHQCHKDGCNRPAHFGQWCKRHVPESERPKGKIT